MAFRRALSKRLCPTPLQQVNDAAPINPQNTSMTNRSPAIAPEQLKRARPPGLVRRLATMLYDLMLLFGVLVVAAALFYTPFYLSGSETIAGPARLAFQVYLLAVIVLYYWYFWTSGRQTLGMRAWRIRLVRQDGADLSGTDALRRLGFGAVTLAPLGIGLLWMLFDPNRLTWYDRLSGTRPVLIAQSKRKLG
jgi:uncharacterized RDD family membrane protein YckC